MKYMIMLFGEAATWWETKSPEWLNEMHQFMMKTDQALRDSGEYVDGRALADGQTAKTVVIKDGAPVPTDGPFAESKESLVGFWIVDVDSEARAIEIASEVVAFTERPLEVRQVMSAPAEI